MGVSEHQFNAIVWAVWGQGTNRLVRERPNGDVVTDQNERLWRARTLHRKPDVCPHWATYRAHAEPLVIESACQQFPGQPEAMALQLLFARLQSRPWEGMPALRRVSQHADLDHIVEADVWPWLERESAAAQAISRPEGEGGSAAGGDSTELLSHEARALLRKAAEGTGVLHYREQIEPLAKFAYRLHELGTQAAYLATRELGGSTGTRQTLLSDDDARILTTYATILMQHSTWVRSCAVQARYAAITSDQVRRIGRTASDDDGNHQWWADLTTRPITSDVRDAVARAMTHGEIASLLRNLADESDALHTEIGDAFERVGWNRNIAAGTSCVGPGFRTVSERLSATDREGSEPGSGEGEGPGARDG